MSASLLEEFLD